MRGEELKEGGGRFVEDKEYLPSQCIQRKQIGILLLH